MSKYDTDKLVGQDPHEFYTKTFRENYPRPRYSHLVGSAAIRLTKAELHFPKDMTGADYMDVLADKPAIVLFNHPGKQELHDPIAALAAIRSVPDWMRRVETFRPWVKAPILQDRTTRAITEHLGCQLVQRWKDLPDDEVRGDWNDALFAESQAHMNERLGSIAIFPAGTRGATKIQSGAGRLAEGIDVSLGALIVPIAFLSSSEETGQVPKNLQISYGVPIPIDGTHTGKGYTEIITQHMSDALQIIR